MAAFGRTATGMMRPKEDIYKHILRFFDEPMALTASSKLIMWNDYAST